MNQTSDGRSAQEPASGHEPEHTPPGATSRQRESIPDLLRDVASNVSVMLSKEVSLARAELRETATGVQTAIASTAMGSALAMAGLVVLLLGAAAALENVLAPWLAAIIVGVAALLIGYLMVRSAKSRIGPDAAVPERTVAAVKKDQQTTKRALR